MTIIVRKIMMSMILTMHTSPTPSTVTRNTALKHTAITIAKRVVTKRPLPHR
jgi:hypothetical protein